MRGEWQSLCISAIYNTFPTLYRPLSKKNCMIIIYKSSYITISWMVLKIRVTSSKNYFISSQFWRNFYFYFGLPVLGRPSPFQVQKKCWPRKIVCIIIISWPPTPPLLLLPNNGYLYCSIARSVWQVFWKKMGNFLSKKTIKAKVLEVKVIESDLEQWALSSC